MCWKAMLARVEQWTRRYPYLEGELKLSRARKEERAEVEQ